MLKALFYLRSMNRLFDSWTQFPEDGERNWFKSFILFHPQGEFSSLGLTHFLIIPPVNVSQCSLGSVSFPSLHCPLTACIYKGEIICIKMLTHGCHYLAKGFFCLAQLHKNKLSFTLLLQCKYQSLNPYILSTRGWKRLSIVLYSN